MSFIRQPAEGRTQIIIQDAYGCNIFFGSNNGHICGSLINKQPAVIILAQDTKQITLPVTAECILETEPVRSPDLELLLWLPFIYVKQGKVILPQKPVHQYGRIVRLSFRGCRLFQAYQLADTLHNFIRYVILLFHT